MGIGGAFGYPGLAYLTRYWFDLKHFGLVFGIAQTVAATANTLGQAAGRVSDTGADLAGHHAVGGVHRISAADCVSHAGA